MSNEKGDNKYNETLQNANPKATRHVILIRHGQYNLDGNTDQDRVLTKLGEVNENVFNIYI